MLLFPVAECVNVLNCAPSSAFALLTETVIWRRSPAGETFFAVIPCSESHSETSEMVTDVGRTNLAT
jgi:hypothetical protein